MASEDGILVDYVKVDDDVAVQNSLYTVGRRGVAGTIFVHKIAGAAAESGLGIASVKAIAEKVVNNTRSLGFAFSSCTVPAKGTPTFKLNENEMEYGVGIHGEPGVQREKIITSDDLANRITTSLLAELNIKDNIGVEVALLVNGFGATPLQELYVFTHSVSRILDKAKVSVQKTLVGNYMTSIDMAGASISIMVLDDELKKYLAEPCDTPALKITDSLETCIFNAPCNESEELMDVNEIELSDNASIIESDMLSIDNITYAIKQMSDCIIRNEVPFCELDAHAGDGDFGMSVAKGFHQLKKEWNNLLINHRKSIGDFLEACSLIIMEHCGGASGPIWGSAFRAAGKYASGKMYLSLNEYAQMMQAAVIGIQKTGERSFGRGAKVGDKTLLDALIPYTESLVADGASGKSIAEAFENANRSARIGAEATRDIVARMGRVGTVGERSVGFPDAGAHALGIIFAEISNYFRHEL